MEPDLDSGSGSLFVCSDAQQADVTLVEVIATQQNIIQNIRNKMDTATVQEAASVSARLLAKCQVRVRPIPS